MYFISQGLVRYQYRLQHRELHVKHRNTKCHRALCAELTKAREAAGMSMRQLSTKLKRSQNFVHFVESGNRTLSVCEFIEYAHALGTDPAQLVRRIVDV
jgi:ribosome-binding protein aMBF1 (putative translation factor)